MKRITLYKLRHISFLLLVTVFTVDMYKKYKSPFVFLIPILIFIIPRILLRVFMKKLYVGRKLMQQKQFNKAIQTYEELLNEIERKKWLKPLLIVTAGAYTHNYPAIIYNNIASCYINSSQYKKGRDAINKSLKLDDQYAIGYYNLAIVDVIDNRIKSAEKNFSKARETGFKVKDFDAFVKHIQEIYNKAKNAPHPL